MKFYYNGKLIRTSKNHTYTHAVIDMSDGSLKGCRASKETAEALIRSEISQYEKWIAEKKKAIKAIENGKNYYITKERGRSYKITIDQPYQTIEWYTKGIEGNNKGIEHIKANWQVVELEAR